MLPGLARKQPQCAFVGLNALARGEVLESLDYRRVRDAAEVVALQARENRLGHLLRLGGREDELEMRGRLLERLQHRVEGLVGELMRFVDDVNLEAIARGAVAQVFDNRARIIDLAVGCAIDLDYVERAAGPDFLTCSALSARLGRRALLAVETARKDARGGGLADAANPGEQKRMRDASALERLDQCVGDVLLTDQLGEALGAPLAGEHQVGRRRRGHGWSLCRALPAE